MFFGNGGNVIDTSRELFLQWKFQDPKIEVLYHIRPYFVGIFPSIGQTYMVGTSNQSVPEMASDFMMLSRSFRDLSFSDIAYIVKRFVFLS